MPGGGVMHRLLCGDSLIKLVHHAKTPSAKAPPGGINGATGIRYWTMRVDNLEEIAKAVDEAGCPVAIPVTEFRPGVRVLMVEDPDGNWVEFVQYAEGAA